MADTIQADPEKLQEISDRLSQVYDELRGPYDRAVYVYNNIHDHWQGEAADDFVQDDAEVTDAWGRLWDALDQGFSGINKIIQILDTANEEARAAHSARTE